MTDVVPSKSSTLPRTPSFRLDGRRALITGASRGIGHAAAVALADAGAEVVLAARNGAELDKCVAAIRQTGGVAHTRVLDVLDLDAVQYALESAAPFDILVNSAGINKPARFIDVTVNDFDAIVDLNLRSTFFVAQAVVKRQVTTGLKGSIIHISSQMGHVGGERRTVYCSSKHAIEGLTKAMAIDLAPYGIRVNSISPTFIETPMTKPFFEETSFRNETLKKIKLGRIGTVEDLMGAVVFLASDASSLMTGSSIVIDGGWTAE